VKDVYPGSPADKAGVKVGDVITSVNGNKNISNKTEKALRDSEISFSETKIGFIRNGKKFLTILRATFDRSLDPVIDKIRDDTFRIRIYELGEFYVDQLTHELISQANTKGAKNLILDLRYNDGGTSVASTKIAAAFCDPPMFSLIDKDGKKFIFKYLNGSIQWKDSSNESNNGVYEGKIEHPSLFRGKVAVLVSRRTYSAGEYLAYILQKLKRAIILGKSTIGGMETSVTTKSFNNGEDIFYYGDRRYQEMNGRWLPARVNPDTVIYDSVSGYLNGHDNTVDEALKYFDSK
jgi:carboxyl-terminal processing protease